MVKYFNEGGWMMWPILGLLVLGIIIVIVKLWLLFRAKIDTKRFVDTVNSTVDSKGVDAAVEICEKTRGPVSAVVHSGLTRVDKGISILERGMENEAAVQMGVLEKGLIWLATVVAVAPMLGFLGTVIGMIQAFQRIKEMNDIVPSEVAGGISVALITTAFGLMVAVPMQICYNWFVSIIDGIVVDMEDGANAVIEKLLEKGIVKG